MIITRRSKIARLPRGIREQLNSRLDQGEEGTSLVAWLNSLPEVQSTLASHFDGKTITEQNLSDWRNGPYREWLIQQDAIRAVQHLNNDIISLRAIAGDITDNVALWLTSRYLVAAQSMIDKDGALDWKMLREFCSDLVALRRGDHSHWRLTLDTSRQQNEDQVELDRRAGGFKLGLEALEVVVAKKPEAKAAYHELLKILHQSGEDVSKDPLVEGLELLRGLLGKTAASKTSLDND